MSGTSFNAILGIAFLVLGFASVFLMFHLWGYPFDKATRTSAAPKWAMYLHRGIGFAYVIVYVVMMTRMVPRLFTYQVEFPARTVVHIIMGLIIGLILLLKISIIRFFRHLEEWMPFLGTGLLACTVVLLGLSLPFSFKDRLLAKKARGGDVFSAASLEHVKKVLPVAELPKEAPLDKLATVAELKHGRDVMVTQCVECHDMKTILAKPRSPQDWTHTVERMGEKPALSAPITEQDQWAVTAYLIAISPDLQASAQKKRQQEQEKKKAKAAAVAALAAAGDVEAKAATEVKPLLEKHCTQCHEVTELDEKPPTNAKQVDSLIGRMVDNGLEAPDADIKVIRAYLLKTYGKGVAKDPKEADDDK
mgnify:FL=1